MYYLASLATILHTVSKPRIRHPPPFYHRWNNTECVQWAQLVWCGLESTMEITLPPPQFLCVVYTLPCTLRFFLLWGRLSLTFIQEAIKLMQSKYIPKTSSVMSLPNYIWVSGINAFSCLQLKYWPILPNGFWKIAVRIDFPWGRFASMESRDTERVWKREKAQGKA